MDYCLEIKNIMANEISLFKDYLNSKESSLLVKDFSYDYKIYHSKSKPLKAKSFNTKLPSFNIKTFKVKDIYGLLYLMEEEKKNPSFYGAIVSYDGVPYNIFSYNFIEMFSVISMMKDFNVYSYYNSDKNQIELSEEDKERTKKYLQNLDIKNIKISHEKKDQKEELYFMCKNRNVEDYGMHLSDLHMKVNDSPAEIIKQVFRISDEYLFNIEAIGPEEIAIDTNDWMVECSIIDLGAVVPAYGWFKKEDENMKDMVCATKHPNISSNGQSYCTGIHVRESITGISELTYGNLNSPLNQNIWGDHSLSIAKEFIELYWSLLISIDIKEMK